jgi:DNA-directed RNA polymerase subunit H (RpoH/RPB5)
MTDERTLLERIEELERVVDEAADYVWMHNVLSHVLERMIPPGLAEEAADYIEAELGSVVEIQRKSSAGQKLERLRQRLLRIAALARGS